MRTREAIEVNQDDFRERRSRLSEPVRPTRRFPCPCRFIVPRPIRVRYAPAFPSPPHAYGSVPPGPARPASRQPNDSDMRPGPGRGAPPLPSRRGMCGCTCGARAARARFRAYRTRTGGLRPGNGFPSQAGHIRVARRISGSFTTLFAPVSCPSAGKRLGYPPPDSDDWE